MASRDFGFLTLRNISAFQPNGNPVPPNQVLATSGNGIGGFTSTIIISSIVVNSIEVSSINNTNQFALSINTNFLNVNSTTTLSTTTINSTLNVNGSVNVSNILYASTINTDKINTGHIVGSLLEVNTTNTNTITTNNIISNNIDVNTVSTSIIASNTINVNTLNSNNISTNNIATNFISTYQKIFLFDNNLSSCYLDNIGSTLYVDGHPVITDASISTVSTVFWNPGPNGSIYNKNLGNNNNNKLVFIGEPTVGGVAPNYTLDVAGTVGIASTLTVSSISNVQNIKSDAISLASATNSSFFIDFTTKIGTGIGFDYPVLRFNSQVTDPNTQNKSLTLHMNDGVPTWRSQWESYIPQSMKFECLDFLVSSSNDVNLYGNSTIKLNSFNTYVSNKLTVSTLSTNSIQMNNGIIDINGSNLILDGSININGSTYISSGLTLYGTTPGGYGALKIQGGLVENDIFIRDGSQVNSATNSGYFVGISNNFGGPSTFQIGRVDAGNAEPLNTLYLTQSGNVGIGTSNPQNKLDVNGTVYISSNLTVGTGYDSITTTINGLLGINKDPGRQLDCEGDAEISGTLYLPNTLASGNVSTTNLTASNTTILKQFVNIESDLDNGNTGGLRILPINSGNASGITISNYSGTSQWSIQNNNNNLQIYNYNQGGVQGGTYIELSTNQITMNRNTTINSTFQVNFNNELQPFRAPNTNNYLFVDNGDDTTNTRLGAYKTNSGPINLCLQTGPSGVASGNVGIRKYNPQYALDVLGDIYASGNITAGSDIRFKTEINTLENALSTVKNLRGVSYHSIDSNRKNIGVIAQEVEKILPEVVITDNTENQYKSVAYGNIVGILIEAIKDLSYKVDNLEKLINRT